MSGFTKLDGTKNIKNQHLICDSNIEKHNENDIDNESNQLNHVDVESSNVSIISNPKQNEEIILPENTAIFQCNLTYECIFLFFF